MLQTNHKINIPTNAGRETLSSVSWLKNQERRNEQHLTILYDKMMNETQFWCTSNIAFNNKRGLRVREAEETTKIKPRIATQQEILEWSPRCYDRTTKSTSKECRYEGLTSDCWISQKEGGGGVRSRVHGSPRTDVSRNRMSKTGPRTNRKRTPKKVRKGKRMGEGYS